MPIRATANYLATRNYARAGAHVVVHSGSARSSKTYSACQWAIQECQEVPDAFIPAFKAELTNAKATLKKTIDAALAGFGYNPASIYRASEAVYHIGSSKIQLFGANDSDKAHGLESSHAIFDEMDQIRRDFFDQVQMRCNGTIVGCLNPAHPSSWVYELKRDTRRNVELHSTFLDNPYCPPRQREKILSWQPTRENILRGTANRYMWQIYGKGHFAPNDYAVYPNIKTIREIPEDYYPIRVGIDFGFTAYAGGVVLYKHKTAPKFIFDELLYIRQLNANQLGSMLKSSMPQTDYTLAVICDSENPDTIDILRSDFKLSAFSCYKPRNIHGIGAYLYNMADIRITERSRNLIAQATALQWDRSRSNQIMDKWKSGQADHLCDPMSYTLIDIGYSSAGESYESPLVEPRDYRELLSDAS